MVGKILQLSFRYGLCHIGSNLSAWPILDRIYSNPAVDRVILSQGHAGLALYCALEKYRGLSTEQLLLKHGPHPHYDPEAGILCSSGSLGQGITIAVGYGIQDRARRVDCLVSDGECSEGCVWEALAFIRTSNLDNLHVHVNMNGYRGLGSVDTEYLTNRLLSFLPGVWITHYTNSFPFLDGMDGHYKTMTKEEYQSTMTTHEKTVC